MLRETAFVSEGFVSNTEELLNLDPDIVFYYGDSQKSGIENLGIPTVDFMIKGLLILLMLVSLLRGRYHMDSGELWQVFQSG